jgi:predicted nucleotide-binding protein (sugar kinase/HSP70/actin superfamily)
MGVIRINDKLQKRLQEWLDKNGNNYRFPSITAFVNNAIYEKLNELESKKNEEKK